MWMTSLRNLRVIHLYLLTIISPASALFGFDGFGRGATGGAGGTSVIVTNAADFISYATSDAPCTITISGTIILPNNLGVLSNKTIQGADSNATINGDLRLGAGVRNVIIRYLNITNPSGVGDGDGVTIIDGANNIVVSHCTFTDCADGELDITNGSDSVTVSWCRFRYVNQTTHRNVNLVGSSDTRTDDLGFLHVTFHHCWYEQLCTERMPSVRFGRVHVYNNYFSAVGNNYCVRTRLYAECLVENNYFENVQNPWELLTTEGMMDGKVHASNNNVSFMDSSNGVKWVSGWYTAPGQTQILIDGTDSVFTPPYAYTPDNPLDVKSMVIAGAGNHGIVDGVAEPSAPLPGFTLHQNYPNPFNPSTTVRWSIVQSGNVFLTVYDVLGREMTALENRHMAPGEYSAVFDGNRFPSGAYFFRLQVGNRVAVKKSQLLK
jgi:pectate lyase